MSNKNARTAALRALGLGLALTSFGLVLVGLGASPDPAGLAASPRGIANDYELVVVLKSDEVPTFEYRKALERVDFQDIRFAPQKARDEAVKEAKAQLAKKRGYFQQLYGEGSQQLERVRVVDVVLMDHRTDTRISILRQSGV